jgi:hypothetical protein
VQALVPMSMLHRYYHTVMQCILTSSKSQAHTAPVSSPQMMLASPCPKHALQRYCVTEWPINLFSSFPVPESINRSSESRVVTRYVLVSCVGTTAVTGSVSPVEQKQGQHHRHQRIFFTRDGATIGKNSSASATSKKRYPDHSRPMKSERSSPLRMS